MFVCWVLFWHTFIGLWLWVEVVAGWWLIIPSLFFIPSVLIWVCAHHHFDRIKVSLTSATSLTQLCIFALQVEHALLNFITSVGNPGHFLASLAFGALSPLLLCLVHGGACLQLGRLRLVPHVVFVEFGHLSDVLLRFYFQLANQLFNLGFVLFDQYFHRLFLRLQLGDARLASDNDQFFIVHLRL